MCKFTKDHAVGHMRLIQLVYASKGEVRTVQVDQTAVKMPADRQMLERVTV